MASAGESFGHDLDGNLVRDGRWTYTWDAENRLVKMESFPNAPTGSKRRFEFAYDHQGRRIWKRVTNLDSSTVTAERKFLYDGWNLIAELDGAGTVLRKYVWGLDLSGSFQGAGGVGGLLKIVDTALGSHFCAYDGNGNLSALVKAADGDVSAQYEYGPFGELIRATGPAIDSTAKANPFRFSTKYQDDETDLLYYGYRYYNASTGRWLSRDPIEERGGRNLYAMVENVPSRLFDADGRQSSIDNVARQAFVDNSIRCRPLFSPSESEPAVGNQLFGYPNGADLSRWFERKQTATLSYWTQTGISRLTKSIRSACAGGVGPETQAGKTLVEEVIVPGEMPSGMSDLRYWWPWWPVPINNPEVNEQLPGEMGRWDATKALGRYTIRFKINSVSRVYCTCSPCFFWQGSIEVVDTPGITSAEDGLRGRIGTALGVLTDSPEVVIARWSHSGAVCCE